MTYAESVARDVAARYGVPVAPDAVQVVPRGVSARPQYVWDEKSGQLILPGWKEQFRRDQSAALRAKRKADPHFNRGRRDAIVAERRDKVRAMLAQGMTDAAIAAALDLSPDLVKKDRRTMGLKSNLPPQAEVAAARDAEVRALVAQGMDRRQIAAALGLSPVRVSVLAKRAGVSLPKPDPRENLRARQAEQLAVRAAREDRIRSLLAASTPAPDLIAILGVRLETLLNDFSRMGIPYVDPSKPKSVAAARAYAARRAAAKGEAA